MPDDNNDPRRTTATTQPQRKGTNRVRLLTDVTAAGSETGFGRTVFEHEDADVARQYVETHHPRGREVVLQGADGKVTHFSADHKIGENDGWLDYSEDEV